MCNETDSLEAKITAELQRTGYPTEIVAARAMQNQGWAVVHNPSYLDDVEQRSREFDIRAFRSWPVGTDAAPAYLGVYLLTECKKSEKPWVFFTTNEPPPVGRRGRLIKVSPARSQLFWSDTLGGSGLISNDELRASHHYFQTDKRARTYYEPFKGHEQDGRAQMIYSAVMSATKATLFYQRNEARDGWFRVFYPLIVFTGEMFEASVDNSMQTYLRPLTEVQISHHYVTATSDDSQDNEHEFIVDVVHPNNLSFFLDQVGAEHTMMAERIRAAIASGNLRANRPSRSM